MDRPGVAALPVCAMFVVLLGLPLISAECLYFHVVWHPASTSGAQVVSFANESVRRLVTDTAYVGVIDVVTQDGVVDTVARGLLVSTGVRPVVWFEELEVLGLSAGLQNAGWHVAVKSPSTPGDVGITVRGGSGFGDTGLVQSAVALSSPGVEVCPTRILASVSFLLVNHSSFGVGTLVSDLGTNSMGASIVADKLTLRLPATHSTMSAVVSASSSVVLVTEDAFRSQHLVNLSASQHGVGSAGMLEACSDYPKISSIWSTPFRVLVATPVGLLQGARAAGNAPFEWTRVLPRCIGLVEGSSQTSGSGDRTRDVVLAVSSTGPWVWMSANTSSAFQVLVNTANQSVHEHLGWSAADTRIVSASFVALSPRQFVFLVNHTSAGSSLVSFTFTEDAVDQYSTHSLGYTRIANAEWSLLTSFPTHIRGSEALQNPHARPTLLTSLGADFGPVKLTGMTLSRSPSGGVFVWGNVVLKADAPGMQFSVLRSFTDTEVETLVTSVSGAFAVLTMDRHLWYGDSSSRSLIQLSIPDPATGALLFPVRPSGVQASTLPSTLDRSLVAPFFDLRDRLLVAAVRNGSATPWAVRTADLRPDVLTALVVHAEQVACPLKQAYFSGSVSSDVTRVAGPSVDSRLGTPLPHTVYLDWRQSYVFDVEMVSAVAGAPVALDTMWLGSGVTVSVDYRPGTISSTATVTITEAEERREQGPSGRNLTVSTLRVGFSGTNLLCERASDPLRAVRLPYGPITPASEPASASGAVVAAVLESSTAQRASAYVDLTVQTGCPPGRRLEFDAGLTRHEFDSCITLFGVPCLSFTYEFEPKLWLVDTVTQRRSAFVGRYAFEVVAGGATRDALRWYSDGEMEAFNQGDQSVWTSLDSISGNVLPAGATINWVCGFGSPCGDVVPSWPDAPDFYFLVRLNTKGALADTHCAYSTEVLIRLHGLTLDYLTLTWIVLVTMATLIAGVMVMYSRVRRRYMLFEEEVQAAVRDIEGDTDDESSVGLSDIEETKAEDKNTGTAPKPLLSNTKRSDRRSTMSDKRATMSTALRGGGKPRPKRRTVTFKDS